MPLVALGIAAGVAGGAAQAYGAKKSSESSDRAAAVSAQSNAAAIAEQQRQDAIQQQQFAASQAAQKAQWDAEQQIRAPYRQAGSAALSQLGGILGVDFGSGGGGAAAPSAPAASGPTPTGIDWTAPPDVLAQKLTAYYQAAGVPAHEVPYWVSKAPELVARGKELGDPNYANSRLAASDVFGGARPTASAALPRTIAPLAMPAAGNALAPSYAPVVPVSTLMGMR